MLELASVGAKVLQTRSVELAMKERVRVQVLSSLPTRPAPWLVDEDEIVEKEIVAGIAYSRDEAKITVRRVPDRPGIAAAIFGRWPSQNVNVDMIVQNVSEDGTTDMTFTVGKADLPRAHRLLETARQADRLRRAAGPTRTSPRSAWSASACAAMPAWPARCSARWPTRASISR
jgi:aspartate kinase